MMRVHAFKEDMASQIILLMGLPAAGKSTFVKTELIKHYHHRMPHLTSFKILNSDVQLRRMQYERALNDHALLSTLKEEDWARGISRLPYRANDGKLVDFDLSWAEFQTLRGPKDYWKRMYKPYYATYFGDRAAAKQATDQLALRKIQSGDVVIIDSTGVDTAKMLGYFKTAKDKGYTTSVVRLEIDPKITIARDQYRGETEGRSVGEKVIRAYVPKLAAAYKKYMSSDLVDRLLHFRWVPAGPDEVVKGKYRLVREMKRYGGGRSSKDLAAALEARGHRDLAIALVAAATRPPARSSVSWSSRRSVGRADAAGRLHRS